MRGSRPSTCSPSAASTAAAKAICTTSPRHGIDGRYAHKPGVISKDGKVYHFYCAVAPAEDPKQGEIEYGEVRGISVAAG